MARSRPDPGSFDVAVWTLVRRIPRGRVVTYGQVAALVGIPRAARAVGQAMRRCPPSVPWHRVVNGRGGVSRRPDPTSMLTQRLLLGREGVRLLGGRVDLGRYRWTRGVARPRVDIAALPTAW
jgi:methylated-DNA-protein-cysteine methyltransferase related protein